MKTLFSKKICSFLQHLRLPSRLARRRVIAFLVSFSHVYSSCAIAGGGRLHTINEELTLPAVTQYAGSRMGVVTPAVTIDDTAHNILGDTEITGDGGILFATTPGSRRVYNRIYSKHPAYLGGIIKSDQPETTMVFASPSGLTLDNPDFQQIKSLSLLAGGIAPTEKGMSYGIDQAAIFMKDVIMKAGEDVKDLSLAAHTLNIKNSILAPENQIDISMGRHIRTLQNKDETQLPVKDEKGLSSSLFIDSKSSLQSKKISLNSFDKDVEIRVEGLIQSTHEDIIIHARGDVYINKLVSARNLTICTDGMVFFKEKAFVKGNVNVKAQFIHIASDFRAGEGNISFETTNFIQVDGILASHGKINFLGRGGIQLQGAIVSKDEINLLSTGDIFQAGSLFAGKDLSIQGTNFIKKGHVFSEGNLNILSDNNIDLQSGELVGSKSSILKSKAGQILSQSRIVSEGPLLLDAQKTENFGIIESRDVLTHHGSFINYFTGHLNVKSIKALQAVLEENRGTVELQDSFVLPKGMTHLKGAIKTHGMAELIGKELTLEGSLFAGKGLIFQLDTFVNQGSLTVDGEGAKGSVTKFENQGDIELAGANLKLATVSNEGALRTKGHFLLQGKNFTNKENGRIFTCGVHQLDITGTTDKEGIYIDNGYLHTPTLFLVRAEQITFSPSHRSYISQGVVEAAARLDVSGGAEFLMQKDGICSLQFSSDGVVNFNGKLTLRSDQFPLLDYFDGGDDYARRLKKNRDKKRQCPVDYQDFEYELRYLSLDPWLSVKRDLRLGVSFISGHDITYKGTSSLDNSSVHFSAKGDIYLSKGKVRAGYFSGDSISLQSIDSHISQSKLQAPAGSYSHKATGKGTYDGSHVTVGWGIDASADSFQIKDSQFVGTGQGAASSESQKKKKSSFSLSRFFKTFDFKKAHVTIGTISEGSKSIREKMRKPEPEMEVSPHLLKQIATAKEQQKRSLSQKSSTHQASSSLSSPQASPLKQAPQFNLSGSKSFTMIDSTADNQKGSTSLYGGHSVHAERSTLKAFTEVSIVTDGSGHVSDSLVKGKTTLTQAKGPLTFKRNVVHGEKNLIKAGGGLNTESNISTGETTYVSGEAIRFEGQEQAEHLIADAPLIQQMGKMKTVSTSLKGDVIEQKGTIKADVSINIEALQKYIDTQTSLLQAGGIVRLKAQNNEGFEGQIKADKAVLELKDMELKKLLSQVKACKTEVHLQSGVKIDEDLAITSSLELWAKRLENKASITASSDLMVHTQEQIINQGVLDVHGMGGFFTQGAFENTGTLTTGRQLLVKAKSIFNSHLMSAQQQAILEGTDFVTNLATLLGSQGLSVKTDGLFTHKGTADAGSGLLHIEAEAMDGDAVVKSYQTGDSWARTTEQKVKSSKLAGAQMLLKLIKDSSAKGIELDIKQDAYIDAGGSLNFDPVAYQAAQHHFGFGRHSISTDPRTKYFVTKAKVGGNLSVTTHGTFTARGIQASVGGDIIIKADKGVDVSSLASVYVAERKTWKTGLFGQNRHELVREDVDFYQSSLSSESGGIYIVASDGGITGRGTAFAAAGDIHLDAKGKVDLNALKAEIKTYQYDEDKFLCFGSSDEKEAKEKRARVIQAQSNKKIKIRSQESSIEAEAPYMSAPEIELEAKTDIKLSALELGREEMVRHLENNLNVGTDLEVEHKERTTQTTRTMQQAGTIKANKFSVTTGKGGRTFLTADITGHTEGGKTDFVADTDEVVFSGLKSTYNSAMDSWSASLSIDPTLTPGAGGSFGFERRKGVTYAATLQNFGVFYNKRAGAKLTVHQGAQTNIDEVDGEALQATEDANAQDEESQEGFEMKVKVSSTASSGSVSAKWGEKVSKDILTSLRIGKHSDKVTIARIKHDDRVKDTRAGFGVGVTTSADGLSSVSASIEVGERRIGISYSVEQNPLNPKNMLSAKDNMERAGSAVNAVAAVTQNLESNGVNTGIVGQAASGTQQGFTVVDQGKALYSSEGSTMQKVGNATEMLGGANDIARTARIDTAIVGEIIDGARTAGRAGGFVDKAIDHHQQTRADTARRGPASMAKPVEEDMMAAIDEPVASSSSAKDEDSEELGEEWWSSEDEFEGYDSEDVDLEEEASRKPAKKSTSRDIAAVIEEESAAPGSSVEDKEAEDQLSQFKDRLGELLENPYARSVLAKLVQKKAAAQSEGKDWDEKREEAAIKDIIAEIRPDTTPYIDPVSDLLPALKILRGATTLKGVSIVAKTVIENYVTSKLSSITGEASGELAGEIAGYFGASPEVQQATSSAVGYVVAEVTSMAAGKAKGTVLSVHKKKKPERPKDKRFIERVEAEGAPNKSHSEVYAERYKQPAREKPETKVDKIDRYKEQLLERPGKDKRKETSLQGARTELRGGKTAAAIRDGRDYDHVEKVGAAQKGLLNNIKERQETLKAQEHLAPEKRLSGSEKAKIEHDLSKASSLLDYSEGFVPRGKGN